MRNCAAGAYCKLFKINSRNPAAGFEAEMLKIDFLTLFAVCLLLGTAAAESSGSGG